MASKAFPFFIITFSLFFHSISADANLKIQSSPSEFIKHLQGAKKGDKVKGIHHIKKYLERYGYLNYNNSIKKTYADEDDFDELLESAIKTYQLNFNLDTTGVLDVKTIAMIETPRCGVPDFVNGQTTMRAGKIGNHSYHGSGRFHAVSHYAFFPGNPKWPASKYNLTFAFPPGVTIPVIPAFNSWTANTQFTFSQTQDYANADVKLSYQTWDHGDGHPFDGPGKVLAHAFAPTDGRLHFDGDEKWTVGGVGDSFDLVSIALHEIGHVLGLGHSSVRNASMWPSFGVGEIRSLNQDDIQGIKALYNV